METELKYRLPNQSTLDQLATIEELGGLEVGPSRTVVDHDRYLDTPNAVLLRSGHSCRERHRSDGRRLLTIKSVQLATGPLHQRSEMEFELPPDAAGDDPGSWPESPARDLVRSLAGTSRLELLFAFDQTRRLRSAGPDTSAEPQVELSLDVMDLGVPGAVLLGLEAELLPGGDSTLLGSLAAVFASDWQLEPEPRSKFWQAIAVLRPDLLPPVERDGDDS